MFPVVSERSGILCICFPGGCVQEISKETTGQGMHNCAGGPLLCSGHAGPVTSWELSGKLLG